MKDTHTVFGECSGGGINNGKGNDLFCSGTFNLFEMERLEGKYKVTISTTPTENSREFHFQVYRADGQRSMWWGLAPESTHRCMYFLGSEAIWETIPEGIDGNAFFVRYISLEKIG